MCLWVYWSLFLSLSLCVWYVCRSEDNLQVHDFFVLYMQCKDQIQAIKLGIKHFDPLCHLTESQPLSLRQVTSFYLESLTCKFSQLGVLISCEVLMCHKNCKITWTY